MDGPTPPEIMTRCIRDRSKSTCRANAAAVSVLALIGALALLGIGWERVASVGDESGMRVLTNENNNNKKEAAGKTTPTKIRKMASGNGNGNSISSTAAARQNNAVADHEWKTPPSNPDTDADADATERTLYRKCPPGVDSVTGSFCGLSYEQICCFCPQPLDCESDGCPADADGVVRDGCFHSITIPCPDVVCDRDPMTDRAVELGG